MIRTRIAPSPTGMLHVGTARTALFNYLFAKRHGGEFLLRVENTDAERNTDESTQSILDGLRWLGLEWDGDIVYQADNAKRHAEAALSLVESGMAYYSYVSQDEIEVRRAEAEKAGGRYIHRFSPRDEVEVLGVDPVVRFRVRPNVKVVVDDLVQGKIAISTDTIEDFIVLRANGQPVYNLAVVCDDIDMKITDIIRGNDHLTNAAKHVLLFRALGATVPHMAHVPLINGEDGRKLSKRSGAVSIGEYEKMGYLPEALNSYIARLGWSAQNDEVLRLEEIVGQFSLDRVSKSPACFDFKKLNHVNSWFVANSSNEELRLSLLKWLEVARMDVTSVEGVAQGVLDLDMEKIESLDRALDVLKSRSETLADMACGLFPFQSGFAIPEPAKEVLRSGEMSEGLSLAVDFLNKQRNGNASGPKFGSREVFEKVRVDFKDFLKEKGVKMSKVGPAMRLGLIGSPSSIGVFDILYALGFSESLERLTKALGVADGSS